MIFDLKELLLLILKIIMITEKALKRSESGGIQVLLSAKEKYKVKYLSWKVET